MRRNQAACIEFRKLGFEGYSCDLQECSGEHPEWHFNLDILKVIGGGQLELQNRNKVFIDKWDIMIAFPPCTHLAVSGARYFDQKRADGRQQEGIDFFLKLANVDIPRIAIATQYGSLLS
jgi:hypothetical protein